MQSNLILLVGDHGSSKTAAVYTAAAEAGYQIFEINPGVKRSGKDLVAYVGEMTSSHLVTHFMRRFTGAANAPSPVATATEAPEIDVIHIDDGSSSQGSHQTTAASTAAESAAFETQQQQEQEPKQSLVLLEEVDTLYEDDKGFWASVIELAQKSKRPIVLTCNDRNLIPTDMLYLQGTLNYRCPDSEELMAYLHLLCFSEGYLVHPADLAGLVATTGYDLRRLINTLELWCTENDDSARSALIDVGKSGEDDDAEDPGVLLYECADLFDRYTGINGAANTTGDHSNGFDSTSRIDQQLFRIQQPTSKCGVDLVRFHEKCIANDDNCHGNDTNNSTTTKKGGYTNSLLETVEQLNRASWGDVLMGTSARRNRQLHECDEYGPSQDQLLGYTTMWKHPTDLDHWSLSEDMPSYFWVQAYESIRDDTWRKALLPTVWEELVKERALAIDDCLFGAGDLISWRAYLSDTVTMMDYVPHIRMMCDYDQGVASRRRAPRTRRKRRYLPLSDEQVDAVQESPEYRDTTHEWCEKILEWSKRFSVVVVNESGIGFKGHTPAS
ncbi:P-loop containing nucleoside triphosphate hydrolase protein [Zychaea mexicana]|uniref:P-loop containing nucleoside triphosphate hydrolase protein n=1 Tax=Zychaea mexicana TaxID=64656 RepID=UPI0022FE5680|nr:P-loop containing nucleoside triphosphate hydrolase protein [Zychaea mexicana]KAI9484417.1 P-loop containing nucleoside triphosphate hydrolase protein [Zychaea mexicana]